MNNKRNNLFHNLKELYAERKVLLELSKNDFSARYTNSLFGIAWAFVLPLTIILVLWFVFQVGFRSAPIANVPFILWYIPAFLAWNFFTDAFGTATTCYSDYYYLVKNMKFRIGILPFIKILSASYIHFFFIAFIFFIYFCYGFYPSINNIQVIYYYICTVVFLIGITWITSALAVFTKDVVSVISLIIQVGFWATPLIWDASSFSPIVQKIVKLNPLYYICNGYRESFCTDIWFWEHPTLTIYFWSFAIIQLIIGFYIYKRLKPQFADML